ncbi:hypothetical protein Tco_1180098, partial [Tanacetum coccineum]
GKSSYARVMIEIRADVELKDNIIVAMPKITREECPKNTFVGEKKTMKKPSQTSRGVPVGLKMGFKPHKEYRRVLKKFNASSSGNKKKGVEPTIEVSNSNPFDVLNSVDNDVEFSTNGGTNNLVNNGATSSGSSFMNFDNSSSGTTSIIEKIGKFEDLITSGQAILVDKDVNPLKNVEFPSEYDSEDKVASVDNDMTHSMTYERVFGTQSLLENERIRMVMVTKMMTHTMMICTKMKIFLMSFKLYVIIWISVFEVARRNKSMFLLSSHFVYLSFRK